MDPCPSCDAEPPGFDGQECKCGYRRKSRKKEEFSGKDIRRGRLVWLKSRRGGSLPNYPGVITRVSHKTWTFWVLSLEDMVERGYAYLTVMDPGYLISMRVASVAEVTQYLNGRDEVLRDAYYEAKEMSLVARDHYRTYSEGRRRARKIVGSRI